MAVAASAHRVNQILVLEERCLVHAGELRDLILVDKYLILLLASPHRHEQRLQHDVGVLTALHCPADPPAGIGIEDDSEVGEALDGPVIGDVRDRCLVRTLDVKLPGDRIVDNDGRPAALFARTTLATDLSLDPGKPCQTRDAVRSTYLSLIEQIVMKLAIVLDLAALFPSLKQEIALSLVLTGPFARRVLQPGVEPARVNMEKPTHRPHRKSLLMLGNERVLHFASLAKYAAAFLGCGAPR